MPSYSKAYSIKVEGMAFASGLDFASNLDLSSFKLNSTQDGDTVTVNMEGDTKVVGAGKNFEVTITVPPATVIERLPKAKDCQHGEACGFQCALPRIY